MDLADSGRQLRGAPPRLRIVLRGRPQIQWLRPDAELVVECASAGMSTRVRVTSDDDGTPHYSGRIEARECRIPRNSPPRWRSSCRR
jgi:hypothetical protein